MIPTALRVLYFTIVDIGRVDNGGGLVCRNHAARIAETPDVSLTICNVGASAQRRASEDFAQQIGADFRFLVLDQCAQLPDIRSAFIFEREGAAQTRVHREAERVLDDVRPDVVVVDYLYSTLYAPPIYRRRDLRRIAITLNRESRFFGGLLAPCRSPLSLLKIARLWLYEQSIYARSHAVVALNGLDVTPFPWLKRVVIAPIFERNPKSWHGRKGNLLFVGNADHLPNRQAIEWLCFRFASEFAKQSAARIVIVGAGADDFPSGVPSNVDLLGASTAAAVGDCTRDAGYSWPRSPTAMAARSSCCNVCHWARRSWRRSRASRARLSDQHVLESTFGERPAVRHEALGDDRAQVGEDPLPHARVDVLEDVRLGERGVAVVLERQRTATPTRPSSRRRAGTARRARSAAAAGS